MNTRWVTLTATIIAIALVAIGIGYAYTAYSENNGNNTEISYVTITQTGTTGYTFAEDVKVYLETYNKTDTETVYFRLSDSQDLTDGSKSYTLKSLGTITLHAEISGSDSHPDLNISIARSTNFDASTNWLYIIGSAPVNGTIEVYAIKDTSKATSSWTSKNALIMHYEDQTGYDNKVLYVYYGYLSNNATVIGGKSYMSIAEMPKDLIDASIVFMASNDTQDKIVYHSTNESSPIQEYTVSNTQNESRTYTLTDPTNLGFTSPPNKVFKGWCLTPSGNDYIRTVTLSSSNSVDVYAIYGDAE